MEGGGEMRWNRPMRFAYADPPYLGCGAKHYGRQHAEAMLYDDPNAHRHLIARLMCDYPDGWALSLHTPSLMLISRILGEVASDDYFRWGSWVKPFASFKPNVNPGYCWEPVVFYGGRSAKERGGREVETVRDYVSAPITLQRGTSGAKPEAVCFWIFDFLGARHGDEFHDLFPGSGAVTRAWEKWTAQTRMFA